MLLNAYPFICVIYLYILLVSLWAILNNYQLDGSIQIIRIIVTFSFLYIIVPITLVFSALPAFAQRITNADSLSKNSFSWNQEAKEFGFAHFDEVYRTRDVHRGKKVHKLPQGKSIPAFSKGGQKEKEPDAFMTEQKAAGIFILQYGKIRLERYALGFSDAER